MTVNTKSSENGNELVISIDGRFDFGLQKDFRKSYEATKASAYIVDFRATEYMDSSALGMLLMMREYAGGSKAQITLQNCSQDIKTILSVANFHNLFKIA